MKKLPQRSSFQFLILAVVAFVVAYWPVFDAGFLWDDDDYVLKNDTLRGAAGLWRMWTDPGSLPQWYPLVHSSYWIEFQLWGLDPLGYHVVNWLLHGLNAALLFRLLQRLEIRAAGFAALVFLLHPVHVESVAWITERKNVLSGACYLGAWLVWLRFEQRRDAVSYALALLVFGGALLAKSVTASLPAAILVVDWWRRRLEWGTVRRLLPFFALGLAAGLHTAYMEMFNLRGTGAGAAGAEWSLSLAERFLVAGRTFFFYPAKIVWPEPLVFFYPRWVLDTGSLLQWLFPVAALGTLGALLALRGRIGRGPLAAALFFAGTLFPASGFLNVYPFLFSFVADHFQYLASLGVIVLVAEGLRRLADRVPPLAVAIPVAALLTLLSYRHAESFHDLQALWTDTITKNPACWLAHNSLGNLLDKAGDRERAIHHWNEALRHKPDHELARVGLGNRALADRDLATAERHFRAALADHADSAPAWTGLGVVHGMRDELAQADAAFRTALRHRPEWTAARQNLASLLLRRGHKAAALQLVEDGLRLTPYDADLLGTAAFCLQQLGRVKQARDFAQRALALDAKQPLARRVLVR